MTGVASRLQPTQQQAASGGDDQVAPGGAEEDQVGDDQQRPRQPGAAAEDVVVGEDPLEPRGHREAQQQQDARELGGTPTARTDDLLLGNRAAVLAQRIQPLRQPAEPPVLVHVGDRDAGEAPAQQRDELGGGDRGPAELEEVGLGGEAQRTQLLGPALGQPSRRPGERRLAGIGGAHERPRQGRAVDLAGGRHRQRIEHDDERREPVGQLLGDLGAGVLGVDVADDVADEDLVGGRCALHDDRGGAHAVDGAQLRLDLAELEPASGELDLLVAAPDEVQAVDGLAHEVAAAVGAGPAERGQRCVALAVEPRIEIAAQPDSADDQLAGLAERDRLAGLADDCDLPAGQRPADRDGGAGVHARGGAHDGGLGRSVRVPHLALGREPPRELGRAGLAAEDQQSHRRRARPRPTSRRASAPWRSPWRRARPATGRGRFPVRVSARGAGTSAAPLAHASHISSQLASKETESPASTRSSGLTVQSRASASTKAAAARWLTATPFGRPVEPEVKMTHASSSMLSSTPRTAGVCAP